jgi:dihydropteroate synthase
VSIYEIKYTDTKELADSLRSIGADMRSLPFFENRREVKCFFLSDVDVRAANVIKQEILSRGGDAAVHARAIDCGTSKSDVILFGTVKQLTFLTEKLDMTHWWGMPGIVREIRRALLSISKKTRRVSLPSGSELRFGERTLLMGIINLGGDSFHSESRNYGDLGAALEKTSEHVKNGADILDFGAESTRPGAERIPEEEELATLIPAIRQAREKFPGMPISADTTRLSIAKAALSAGADIINDISGLSFEPGIAEAAAESGAMLIIMHMKGTPKTMRSMCDYDNLLKEINDYFSEKIELAVSHGLDPEKIIIDPGIGFAKNYGQNLFLLKHHESFMIHGKPILIGASRKKSIGLATDSEDTSDRLPGTLAVSTLCARCGVDIIRVHDVKENKKAVMMTEAIMKANYV